MLVRERAFIFFFKAEDGIRDLTVTGVQTCALPICPVDGSRHVEVAGHLEAAAEIGSVGVAQAHSGPLGRHPGGIAERDAPGQEVAADGAGKTADRKSTRLNSSHSQISYAVFCLKKKTKHSSAQPSEGHDRERESRSVMAKRGSPFSVKSCEPCRLRLRKRLNGKYYAKATCHIAA